MTAWEELKRRKLVQWTLAYLAGAWVTLQLAAILAAQFGWPGGVERGLTVLLAFGLPLTLVLAWYHGEKGRQRVSGPELLMVAGILAVAGATIAFVWDEPDPGTAGAAAEVSETAGSRDAPEAEPASVRVSPRSVAVVPLDDHSPSQEHAWFAEAMTEEITTALSRVPELRVTSRSSASEFPESGMSIPEFAREVGVAHVIEGSVRRVDDQVRITAQLIDARTDEHLWSETYERELIDVLDVQVEIARQVADRLAASFSKREEERILAGTTDDPEAYDLLLRSAELDPESSAELEEKIELLGPALERDPEFALAWGQLGEAYFFRRQLTGEPRWTDSVRVYLDRAIALTDEPSIEVGFRALRAIAVGEDPEVAVSLLRRAVEQNPSDDRTAGTLAVAYWFTGDLAAAVRWMRHAAELNPLDPEIWAGLGWYEMLLGRDDRAEKVLRRSIEIDPARPDPWRTLVRLRRLQGRYPEALAAADSLGARNDPLAPVYRARVYLWTGDEERALAAFESVPRQVIRDNWASPSLAHARRLSGDTGGARETLERAEARTEAVPDDPFVIYTRLGIAAVRGDPARTVEALRRYREAGGRRARVIRRSPVFERARSDSAFAAELAELERIVDRQRARAEREVAGRR